MPLNLSASDLIKHIFIPLWYCIHCELNSVHNWDVVSELVTEWPKMQILKIFISKTTLYILIKFGMVGHLYCDNKFMPMDLINTMVSRTGWMGSCKDKQIHTLVHAGTFGLAVLAHYCALCYRYSIYKCTILSSSQALFLFSKLDNIQVHRCHDLTEE